MNLHDIRIREPGSKSLPIDTDDRLISIKKAAELTDVSVKHIYAAVNKLELKSYRIGPKTTRVLLSELKAWWKSLRIRSFSLLK